MSKKILALLVLALTSGAVFAETTVRQIQSPIYTDDIGRSHFMGRGGYSSVRSIQMGEMQSNVVNDAVDKYSNIEKTSNKKVEEVRQEVKSYEQKTSNKIEETELNVLDVIKEKTTVPAASHKSTFTSEKEKMDPSRPQGYSTYLPTGVNESKTIYKDEIGRLHFFGRDNIIKE